MAIAQYVGKAQSHSRCERPPFRVTTRCLPAITPKGSAPHGAAALGWPGDPPDAGVRPLQSDLDKLRLSPSRVVQSIQPAIFWRCLFGGTLFSFFFWVIPLLHALEGTGQHGSTPPAGSFQPGAPYGQPSNAFATWGGNRALIAGSAVGHQQPNRQPACAHASSSRRRKCVWNIARFPSSSKNRQQAHIAWAHNMHTLLNTIRLLQNGFEC